MKRTRRHRPFVFGFCSLLVWATPSQARFLQVDPVGYKDQTNLYAYVGNGPIDATDPDGKEVRVTLVGYPLPDLPSYRHAYILYRDIQTGEMRITRAGPSDGQGHGYRGGSSGGLRNMSDGRSRLEAVDRTVPRSVDRPSQNPGSRVLDAAVVPGNLASMRSQVEALNREVNEQRNAYLPLTANSNAYAGEAFERLTGREAQVNSDIHFPGLNMSHVTPQPVCTWLVRDQGCRR